VRDKDSDSDTEQPQGFLSSSLWDSLGVDEENSDTDDVGASK
jgi:hypothetical protein